MTRLPTFSDSFGDSTPWQSSTFDVIIIGGGPAGYPCAIRATQLGLSVGAGREGQDGRRLRQHRLHPDQGAAVQRVDRQPAPEGSEGTGHRPRARSAVDYGVAMRRSRKVADQNSRGAEFLMKKHKITVIAGTAALTSATTVQVGSDTLTANKGSGAGHRLSQQGHSRHIGLEINKTSVISSDEALFLGGAEDAGHRRRRRGRHRVRRHLRVVRQSSHADRGVAADPAAGRRRVVRRVAKVYKKRGINVLAGRQGGQGRCHARPGDAAHSTPAASTKPSPPRRC